MSTREQDHALEAQIRALGLTAPRVTVEQIDALVDALSFHTYVIPGTTTTVAAAIGPGEFVVALGTSATVSPENFREQLGRDEAIAKAKAMARDKLWELEGWRLKRNLLDLRDAGMLERVLAPELVEAVGELWPSAAVPTAVLKSARSSSCCGRCAPVPARPTSGGA